MENLFKNIQEACTLIDFSSGNGLKGEWFFKDFQALALCWDTRRKGGNDAFTSFRAGKHFQMSF